MPLVSRDRLTRQMQGDPFGSVSQRSRFSVGDPGLFGFLGRAIKSGFAFTKGAVGAQLGLPPASTTSMVKAVASTGPVARPVRARGRYGTTENPAVIQIGGTKVAFPNDPLGIGRRLGIGPFGGLGGTGRRRRRMRVTNPRALRRAMRRVQGFAHLAAKTISFTRRVRMKRHRRRRVA